MQNAIFKWGMLAIRNKLWFICFHTVWPIINISYYKSPHACMHIMSPYLQNIYFRLNNLYTNKELRYTLRMRLTPMLYIFTIMF